MKLLLVCLLTLARGKAAVNSEGDTCYPRVGCFSMKEPWKSAARPLPPPASPDDVGTKFYLYTRNKPARYTINPKTGLTVSGSDFKRSRMTIVITHGFASNGNASWMSEMKDALLKDRNVNVILTDWGNGAAQTNYLQAAANTRMAGREQAGFLRYLIKEKNLKPADVHLIGHSLGAHTSSYAAKNVSGIGRLTGLDPAQPGFQGFNKQVRLSSDDARYVEAIHSDAKTFPPGFGYIPPIAQNDYYLNGGFMQPGCVLPDNNLGVASLQDLGNVAVEAISKVVACPHGRSYVIFTDSIKHPNCTFWGHPAKIVTTAAPVATPGVTPNVIQRTNEKCTIRKCSPLGLKSIEFPARGVFDVTTGDKEPYCIPEPEVDAEIAKEKEENPGLIESLLDILLG